MDMKADSKIQVQEVIMMVHKRKPHSDCDFDSGIDGVLEIPVIKVLAILNISEKTTTNLIF